MEKDVERLSESFQQLQAAVKRFAQAGTAVKTLGEKKEGTSYVHEQCFLSVEATLRALCTRASIFLVIFLSLGDMTAYWKRIHMKQIERHVCMRANRIGCDHAIPPLTQSLPNATRMCLFVRCIHISLSARVCMHLCAYAHRHRDACSIDELTVRDWQSRID